MNNLKNANKNNSKITSKKTNNKFIIILCIFLLGIVGFILIWKLITKKTKLSILVPSTPSPTLTTNPKFITYNEIEKLVNSDKREFFNMEKFEKMENKEQCNTRIGGDNDKREFLVIVDKLPGIIFNVPYSLSWGSKKYKEMPFDLQTTVDGQYRLDYGPIYTGVEGCSGAGRFNSAKTTEKVSLEKLFAERKKYETDQKMNTEEAKAYCVDLARIETINGLKMLLYGECDGMLSSNWTIISGNDRNYVFISQNERDLGTLNSIELR